MTVLPTWTNLESVIKKIDDKGGEKITEDDFKLICKEANEDESFFNKLIKAAKIIEDAQLEWRIATTIKFTIDWFTLTSLIREYIIS